MRCTVDGLNAEDLGRPVRRGEMGWGLAEGKRAAADATKLSEDMAALRDVIKANPDKLDADYTATYERFLQSWQTFVNTVSGKNIPWYDIGKQFGSTMVAYFGSASNFNTVQEYRGKFNQFWQLAAQKLKRPPTPIAPPPPRPPISEKDPVSQAVDTVLKGALTVALVLGGAYVAGNAIARR